MKQMRVFCLLAILSFAVGAFAQGGTKPAAPAASPAASPAAQAQPSPAAPATFASLVDRQVSTYEKNVVDAAEAMPAEKFDFTPASLNIPNAAVQRRAHLRATGKAYRHRELPFVDKCDRRKDAGEH